LKLDVVKTKEKEVFMNRLLFFVSLMMFASIAFGQNDDSYNELSDKQILKLIDKNKPSKSKNLPADIKYRMGATHTDGQYCLTKEPFIIEGAKKLNELGYGCLKLWFGKSDGNEGGYNFNSDWKLTKDISLRDLAQHPYYKEVFGLPFKTFALNINQGYAGASREEQTETLDTIEKEFYELTKYFLREYRNRDVTFILEMWEGDWQLRGGTGEGSQWKKGVTPPDISFRVKNMIDWLNARQKGVSRARSEMGRTTCKVFNAAEVNKVYDGMDGIPSMTTSILPKVKLDMVSWSSYDGKSNDGVKMYRGIDFIRQKFVPTEYMNGKKVVFIGEIGEAENMNNQSRESIRNFWDVMIGVYLAQNIPYTFIWELYCNEPKVGPRTQIKNKTADELRGFWLIKPDGSKSWAQEYFDELLTKSKKG